MSIYDEIVEDARAFAKWAALRNYTKNRIIDEMTDYIDMMIDEGKIVTPSWEWVEPNIFLFKFEPTDEGSNSGIDTVKFTFDYLNLSNPTNDAYDRAMKGI